MVSPETRKMVGRRHQIPLEDSTLYDVVKVLCARQISLVIHCATTIQRALLTMNRFAINTMPVHTYVLMSARS